GRSGTGLRYDAQVCLKSHRDLLATVAGLLATLRMAHQVPQRCALARSLTAAASVRTLSGPPSEVTGTPPTTIVGPLPVVPAAARSSCAASCVRASRRATGPRCRGHDRQGPDHRDRKSTGLDS